MNAEFLTFFEQTNLFEMYVVVSQSFTREIAFLFCSIRKTKRKCCVSILGLALFRFSSISGPV